MTWDTSWVPDQPQAFQLAARITDDSGLIYFTEAVTGLKFKRPGLAVELCMPYDIPKQWVTRAGEKQEKFRVAGDLSKAVAIQPRPVELESRLHERHPPQRHEGLQPGGATLSIFRASGHAAGCPCPGCRGRTSSAPA